MKQNKIEHEKRIEGKNFIINYDGLTYSISKISKYIIFIIIIAFTFFFYHTFKSRIEDKPDLMLVYGIIAALCSYVITDCCYGIYQYILKMPYYNFIRFVNKLYNKSDAELIRNGEIMFRIQGRSCNGNMIHIKIPDVRVNEKTISSGRTIINVYKDYIEIILIK